MSALYVPDPYIITEKPKNKFIVRKNKKQIGVYTNKMAACHSVDRIIASENKTVRNCLCCQTKFVSSGIQHRMCSTCRRLPEPMI